MQHIWFSSFESAFEARKGEGVTVAIKKWGNSLALRIPKDIAQTLHLEKNSTLDLDIKDGALIVKPHGKTLLESLVSGINNDNVHTEVDTGKAMGNEEW